MRIFFSIFTILILLSGCATKSAFSKLDLSQEQELALENTRTGKLALNEKVGGVFSAIYMNNVTEKVDTNLINFFVSVYLKDQNKDLNITMNKQTPIEIKELPHKNEFSTLLPIDSKWSKSYMVSFENNETTQKKKRLNLLIESGQFSSGQLSYLKDLQ